RHGTPAARMPQLDRATVKARAGELRDDVAVQRERWLRGLVGTELSVLAETDGIGHAGNFARVAVPEGTPPGAVVAVTPRTVHRGSWVCRARPGPNGCSAASARPPNGCPRTSPLPSARPGSTMRRSTKSRTR